MKEPRMRFAESLKKTLIYSVAAIAVVHNIEDSSKNDSSVACAAHKAVISEPEPLIELRSFGLGVKNIVIWLKKSLKLHQIERN